MVAKKDFHAPKHPELEQIPNLHVIKAMQSLKSRGYVKEQFAWRHFYWSVQWFIVIYFLMPVVRRLLYFSHILILRLYR